MCFIDAKTKTAEENCHAVKSCNHCQVIILVWHYIYINEDNIKKETCLIYDDVQFNNRRKQVFQNNIKFESINCDLIMTLTKTEQYNLTKKRIYCKATCMRPQCDKRSQST